MRHLILASVAVASLALAPARAAVTLIARGTLSGSTDLSGLTSTLENGVAANILGGVGSGIAYAGGNTFLLAPDRGPNATAYNAAIDNTTSYISRFHTVTLGLAPAASGAPLPYTLTTALTGTTLLSSLTPLNYGSGAGLGVGPGAPAQNGVGTYYFTGRSDNFAPGLSTDPANGRFDPEGIRVSNDGASVFVSDEYGPYVRQFDRATGKLVRTFALPDNLAVADQRPTETAEIADNTSGRTTNKGMEGLALTPDGKTLVGIMQAPLLQDAANPATAKLVRIVTIDIATGATKQFGYNLTTGSGVSEILAISDTEFLIDERDGRGLGDGNAARVKQLFRISLAGAADITNLTGSAAAAAAVAKPAKPFLDLVTALGANGVAANQVPAKIEGISFGQDVVAADGSLLHTLYVVNDNDFLPGTAGPNQFFVFGFTDADLPGLVGQVPEPASWGMMLAGFGLIGAAVRRRARVRFLTA